MSNEWLTVNINPPVMDKPVAVRTADFLGHGRTHEVFTFDSETMDQDGAADYLDGMSFIEWLELPE